MIYCFDIDGTVCDTKGNDYKNSIVKMEMLTAVNELYEEGNEIVFFTARGGTSGIDWTDFTHQQLRTWGFKYHELITNSKPHFDLLIDDKCVNVEAWRKENLPKRKGIIAGCFDVIHPGYVTMWKDAKSQCDYLIVALQTDPTIDRKEKNKPVHSLEERRLILSSIKYIDEVVVYETEKDLNLLLKNIDYDVRILGSDYEGTRFNGHELNKEVYFHNREHHWSASGLRRKIHEEEVMKEKRD